MRQLVSRLVTIDSCHYSHTIANVRRQQLTSPTSRFYVTSLPSSKPSKGSLRPADMARAVDQMPGAVGRLVKWWHRLRPMKQELVDLKLRLLRNKEGFDTKEHKVMRYFVRFPLLTNTQFADWQVTTDATLDAGYSWAEFVRTPNSSTGWTKGGNADFYTESLVPTPDDSDSSSADRDDLFEPYASTYPPDYPKPVPRPGGKHASTAAVVSSLTNPAHKGFGLFRGFISTRVPKRGDLTRAGFANLRSPESSLFGFMTPYSFFSYTHLVIRFRGDGRNYRINILPTSGWDEKLLDGHQFILYTRGGPYWETAKIPLSKLFVLNRGRVRTDQFRLNQHQIRLFSLTLMDQLDGPFSLELDYIGLYCDRSHTEQFAYEKYDRTGIVR